MKKGLMGGSLKVLSQEDLHRIHEASLRLLEEVGMYSESDLILDIFKKAGAMADSQARVIKLSPDMVAAALSTAPASFVLHGREPSMICSSNQAGYILAWEEHPSPAFMITNRGDRASPPQTM
jgi:trimethylamine:corrinoid methyltransferase-like protein